MRKKYTGEKARHRRERQAERQKQIQALKDNKATEDLPEILIPDIWDCLSAPVFEQYWKGEPMSYRMQFWKDHPEYNPLNAINLQ